MSTPKTLPQTTTVSIEWSAFLGALIILGLSLLIGIGVIIASWQYQSYIVKWTKERQGEFGEVEAKYSQLQEALEIVDNLYLDKFNQLQEEGFFLNDSNIDVDELRLKMYEDIKQLLSQLPLITADYSLSEKNLYTVEKIIVEEAFETYETEISLSLGLLHEEDVLQLAEAIDYQRYKGLFNLKRCDLKRLREKVNVKEVTKANFQAQCVLTWYTSKVKVNEDEQ
jgi:tRNA U34 5-carboxymethylaminomethyl modifying enzyme MnmG/GidA